MLKKLILFTAICCPLLLSAQQSKVVSAYNYLNNYNSEKSLDDLRNARKNIDEAALNDGTSGKPKTWYYRGNVYLAIFGSEMKQEVPEALKNAAESYIKVYELDPKYEY